MELGLNGFGFAGVSSCGTRVQWSGGCGVKEMRNLGSMGWVLRGLGVAEVGLNGVGVAGVRNCGTRAQ